MKILPPLSFLSNIYLVILVLAIIKNMSNTDDYLRFNTDSISDLIKQKLAPQFPDVQYRGSSANILTEAIASVFSLISYQVNRSASNAIFSKTQSFESILEQTKMIGYNPIGWVASSMFVDIRPLVSDFSTSRPTVIPRYSLISTEGGIFSTTSDIIFTYSGSDDSAVAEDIVMKGGSWVEYPTQYGDGTLHQTITISSNDEKLEHNSIDVYVRESPSSSWVEWEQKDSLFLSNGNSPHFEYRLNKHGTYDLTFGDGVNGAFLAEGAEIAIYYMNVNDIDGVMSVGEVESNLLKYGTVRLAEILIDVIDFSQSDIVGDVDGKFLSINTSPNTATALPEDVDSVRRNAPVAFQLQNRLITAEDYRTFLLSNLSETVSDILVMTNDEYLDTYMQYYYEMGLNDPHLESRALYNQINFSDSCNFNNIYIFAIPRSGMFLNKSQKSVIVNVVDDMKSLTSNIVPSDPIYMSYGLAVPTNSIEVSDMDTSSLQITKSQNSNRSNDDIINEVYHVITEYFVERGSRFYDNVIDSNELTANLLTINGVGDIFTINGDVSYRGIGLYQFNNQFPSKVTPIPPNTFSGIFTPILLDNNLLGRITITQK